MFAAPQPTPTARRGSALAATGWHATAAQFACSSLREVSAAALKEVEEVSGALVHLQLQRFPPKCCRRTRAASPPRALIVPAGKDAARWAVSKDGHGRLCATRGLPGNLRGVWCQEQASNATAKRANTAHLVLHHALGPLLVQDAVAAFAASDNIAGLEHVLDAAVATDVGDARVGLVWVHRCSAHPPREHAPSDGREGSLLVNPP